MLYISNWTVEQSQSIHYTPDRYIALLRPLLVLLLLPLLHIPNVYIKYQYIGSNNCNAIISRHVSPPAIHRTHTHTLPLYINLNPCTDTCTSTPPSAAITHVQLSFTHVLSHRPLCDWVPSSSTLLTSCWSGKRGIASSSSQRTHSFISTHKSADCRVYCIHRRAHTCKHIVFDIRTIPVPLPVVHTHYIHMLMCFLAHKALQSEWYFTSTITHQLVRGS